MTEQELIRQARVDWPDDKIKNRMDACEAYYMNGVYDDIGGDVESSTGHYYRVDRWIVVTDNQGFKECNEFHTLELAEKAFTELEQQYNKDDEEVTDVSE